MLPEFLCRSAFLLDNDCYDKIKTTTVSIAGLGGVGGLTFLSLVRLGFQKFKLSDNGIFDPPDMNRQILAFNSTMNLNKLDTYIKYGLEINPKLQIQKFSDGINVNNIEGMIKDSDIFVRVIDAEKNLEVKKKSTELLDKYNIPLFQAFTVGGSSLLFNRKPNGMLPKKFWELYNEKEEIIKTYLYSPLIEKRIVDNYNNYKTFSTISTGANFASLLIATEVLIYTLQETSMVEREPIYTPCFVIFNSFDMQMNTLDIRKL